jgi:hypothetical protein
LRKGRGINLPDQAWCIAESQDGLADRLIHAVEGADEPRAPEYHNLARVQALEFSLLPVEFLSLNLTHKVGFAAG